MTLSNFENLFDKDEYHIARSLTFKIFILNNFYRILARMRKIAARIVGIWPAKYTLDWIILKIFIA